MTAFVCRRTGRTYEVGEQLDRDGQAVVHAVVSGGPDLALKQYLPATLRRRPDLEARIRAMIAHPPAYRPAPFGPVICAWPEDAAYISGQFAGFVMPRVDTRDAATIPDVATRQATAWRERVAVAESLARAVAVLHDSDVVIGDFRKWNLLTWSDGRVTLLGCDRMQVVDPESGRRFPCVAGLDECTPPELQLPAALSSTIRTSSSDIFGLALHLHMLLLQGAHPFRGRWRGGGDSPPEHALAQEGLWAYAGDRRLDPGPDAAPLTVLPATLQEYFRAAFVDGARHPEARPPAQAWLDELIRLRASPVARAVEPAAVVAPVHPVAPPPTLHGGTSRGTRPVPPARSDRAASPDAPRRESTPARRHRTALRLSAWAATAAVVVGGVVAVNTVSQPSASPVPDRGVSAQARTTSTSPPTRPADPAAALEQIRAQDAPVVEALADSWVAQLSARPAGTQSADRSAVDAAILADHDALRQRYPGAVLLRSTEWNYDGQFWITVMNERFATAEDANTWCNTNRLAPQDCFAKRLSHSGVVEGSARYRK